MECQKCNNTLDADSKFCPHCGAVVSEEVIVHINDEKVIKKEVSFKDFFFNAKGRTRRQEFFFRAFMPLSVLNVLLIVLARAIEYFQVMGKIQSNDSIVLYVLVFAFSIIVYYFTIIASIKRYHDMNMSGWWSLLFFIPLVNFIALFWLFFSGSKNENNDYGAKNGVYNLTVVRWFLMIVQIALLFILMALFGLLNPKYIDVEKNTAISTTSTEKQAEKQDMLEQTVNSNACDGGDMTDCYNLGRMYENGDGVKQDKFKAVEFYTKACDGGHAAGCFTLGFRYDQGEGVKQNYFKAVELYAKACDGGHAVGCLSLEFMHANGEGMKQDYFKAVELYTKACDAGDAKGCFNLGLTYYKGEGVEQNNKKAKELFGKACDGKNALGCELYAKLNSN